MHGVQINSSEHKESTQTSGYYSMAAHNHTRTQIFYQRCSFLSIFPAFMTHFRGAGGSPSALVLSPTRELAQQIAAVMEEAGARCGVRTVCVYGGVAKPPQAKALRRGVEVVVATPGRLEDLMNDGACK